MSKAPFRDKEVFFLGAGFSKAFGLPLTSELLYCLEELARTSAGKMLNTGHPTGQGFSARLDSVMRALYPDGEIKGFRPSVVDFFSSLSTYIDLSRSFTDTSFPGGNPRALLHQLKRGIARILVEHTRDALIAHKISPALDKIIKPGAIVITSNWDLLVEAAARERGVAFRRSLSTGAAVRKTELTILKLHGSVDWLRPDHRKGSYPDSDYRPLPALSTDTEAPGKLPADSESIWRITWDLKNAWQRISSRSEVSHMVTMATGKMEELGPLEAVWRDAYSAISMARNLYIIGYSMPFDDTEIRTLLRAGVRRGLSRPHVHVRNPSPDVHDRVRRFVSTEIKSNYSGFVP